MDKNIKPKSWDELQSKLKQKYPTLTDNDLQYQEGMEQEMLRMVEYKLRKTTKEMQKIIENL